MLTELRTLRADYEENMKKYKELFDLKMDLDQELAAYKTMLKGEEGRYRVLVEMGRLEVFYMKVMCSLVR